MDYDMYMAKFSPEGNPLWNCTWVTDYCDEGYGIAIDDNGNDRMPPEFE